ncbi:DUF6228 family protein [Streptomyces sp. NPDC058964]|uniref:DUF6228 family protein n=1 Tax=Streptomyces sp. NPDC058964 TaxID=3346681 RepID=UPI0036BBD403
MVTRQSVLRSDHRESSQATAETNGARTWRSPERDLTLSAEHTGSRVRLTWGLHGGFSDDEWYFEATTDRAPGEDMRNFALEMRSFLEVGSRWIEPRGPVARLRRSARRVDLSAGDQAAGQFQDGSSAPDPWGWVGGSTRSCTTTAGPHWLPTCLGRALGWSVRVAAVGPVALSLGGVVRVVAQSSLRQAHT